MPEDQSDSGLGAGFGPTDRVFRRDSAVGEEASGDYYVLDLDSGRYYALGEVGGFIWRRLDGSRELQSIAGAVLREFEISAVEAERDLLDFVTSLRELSLVATGSSK